MLSIRNESANASVAKLHFLDGGGSPLGSLNIYLDAHAVFASAITSGSSLNEPDGEPMSKLIFVVTEGFCIEPADDLAPGDPGEFFLASNFGSLEVIEMASVSDDSELAQDGAWIDCQLIGARFDQGGPWEADPNAGLNPPTQRLSAAASIIKVIDGVINTTAATGLAGFSDVAQHTWPQSGVPDLSSAVDSSQSDGSIDSLVCGVAGCRTDRWSQPIDAVAAALMATTLTADYTIEPGLAAEFEWIIHRPLKRYEQLEPGFAIGSSPILSRFSRQGEIYQTATLGPFPLPDQVPPGTSAFPFPPHRVIQSVSFDLVWDYGPLPDEGPRIGTAESALFAHPAEIFVMSRDVLISWVGWEAGSLRMDLDGHELPLESSDDFLYLGEPVISFAVQQYTNGVLPGGVLANYRGTDQTRRALIVAPPE